MSYPGQSSYGQQPTYGQPANSNWYDNLNPFKSKQQPYGQQQQQPYGQQPSSSFWGGRHRKRRSYKGGNVKPSIDYNTAANGASPIQGIKTAHVKMAGGNAVIKQLSHPIMKDHTRVATMKGGRRRRSRSASRRRTRSARRK